MTRARSVLCLIIGAWVFLGLAGAHAAEFRLVDKQTFTDKSPEQASEANGCLGQATARATVTVAPAKVALDVASDAKASGGFSDCDIEAIARTVDKVTAELMPTGGEQPGDRVPVCFMAQLNAGASAAGDAQARAFVGGGDFPPPVVGGALTVQVSDGRSMRMVVGVAPVVVAANGPGPDRDEGRVACGEEFLLTVGDELTLAHGTEATATISGLSEAQAATRSEVDIEIGPCSESLPPCPGLASPAPALSHVGLALLSLALLGCGVLAARRRGLGGY